MLGTVLAFLVLAGNESAVRSGLPSFEIFFCEYDLRVVKRTDPHSVALTLFIFFGIYHLIVYINQFSAPFYRGQICVTRITINSFLVTSSLIILGERRYYWRLQFFEKTSFSEKYY